MPDDGGSLLVCLHISAVTVLKLSRGSIDARQIFPAYSWPCSRQERLRGQTVSVPSGQSVSSAACGASTVARTHQVEVILDEIAFEGFEWQRSVAHGHDERVVDEPVPYRCHIGAL